MISDGAVHFYNWWIAAAPGAAILSVILGFNFLGDGLRDLLDPRRAE
jgi:peptide/nickel transport system permease protein